MDSTIILLFVIVIMLGFGVVAFFALKKKMIQDNLNIEEEQKRIIDEAKSKAASLLTEAQLEA